MQFPLRFGYVPYPLWRRHLPGGLHALSRPLLRHFYPVDERPSPTTEEVAHYLARWKLLAGMGEAEVAGAMADYQDGVEDASSDAARHPDPAPLPVRLPAQWEPVETVILTWPVQYPPLWVLHAQMVEAITPVADVTVLIPAPVWARAIRLFLASHGGVRLEKVRLLHLPTDDIWVRDYGPIVGLDSASRQVTVNAVYDPLPAYPHASDNAMPERWTAYRGIPLRDLDLHFEGGNLWSDGAGTLILSQQVFRSNPGLTRASLLEKLHGGFAFDKLILTPRLKLEETGHVDLLLKLADAQTVLVSAPASRYNGAALRAAAGVFQHETNARGQAYQVVDLPAPPMYFNWFVFPIWPTYTNSLTVNGRVLVPVYGLRSDDDALDIYRRAMPGHHVIPINCRVSINGGGAVHCLTKEVPMAHRQA